MRRILPISRIHSSLASDWDLDDIQVDTQRSHYGTNDIIETHSNRWATLAKDTAKDPMIWFLVATSILFAILKNYNQSAILLLATLPLITMDALLHWRTQVSTQSLSSHLATRALVIRHGTELTLPTWQLVPGDLVIVPSGTAIPADGIFVGGNNLQVDESTLTGESYPVQKQLLTHVPQYNATPVIDECYWGLAGTQLLTGRAHLRVVYTGAETLYGQIVHSALQTTQERTPLQQAIAKLVFALIISATILCVILAIVRYAQGFGLIDALISAATLAVAALPDEFPVVFTFFLGLGVYRLAQKKALVRRAVSVENIGRITYICSDKTGTMTEGRFQLARYLPATGDALTLLRIATLASRPDSGDLLDMAITEEAQKHHLTLAKRLCTFPFTEDRKRESTIIANDDGTHLMVVTKGAPETVMARCRLDADAHAHWLTQIQQFASLGYKVIACATAQLAPGAAMIEPEAGYEFSGLLGFADAPREGVAEAIAACEQYQIHVLMLTGDHPDTARAVAREIGLGGDAPNVMLAQDLATRLETQSPIDFRNIDVIARAIPTQKLAIVTTLQRAGEVVAVTGDGVNDVPAIKAADIGIAMGERGTSSAREVADIVLMDDNFDSIVNAIREGRQLFTNLQLSYQYLLLIHLPFVLSAAILPLLGYPLIYYPIHIVLIELMIHPTSMLAFQAAPVASHQITARKPRQVRFFTLKDWLSIFTVGLYLTVLVVMSFMLLVAAGNSVAHARAVAFALLAFGGVAITLGLSQPRTMSAQIICACIILATPCGIQIPIIAQFLYFTPLPAHEWLAIIVASGLAYALLRLRKSDD